VAVLALAGGGVYAYMEYFMKPPEPAASATAITSAESQPAAATAGAEPSQPGQPGSTAEPTEPAGAETPGAETAEAQTEQAAEGGGETAEEEAEPAEEEAEPAEAAPEVVDEHQTVHMVSKLLSVRGGKIDQAEVMAAVEKAFPDMERCYLRARKQRPRLKGRVVLSWTVKTSGKAARARRSGGTIKNRAFARCLATAINRTRFPRAKGKAALVRLPFVFEKPKK
jgi:hypothetical protein